MTIENALPVATDVAAASEQQAADTLGATDPTKDGEASTDGDPAAEAKPEKTEAERALARAQRKIDRLVRQREELRAERNQLTRPPIEDSIRPEAADSETLSLSRAELNALVKQEAEKLAPTIKQQRDEIEHRQSIVSTLAKDWGQEKFDSLARDLDDVFDGLADRSGKPKPATDAIFESDAPKALIEYLADPEHADEAEALSRMSAIQAGRAVAKLESKLQAKAAAAKPQASSAATPLAPIRGGGTLNTAPNPSDTKAWMKWANEQERKRA